MELPLFSAFRCNAIQALEGIVAEAQAVARCGRHGRQAAVAFFAVAVGVALRVGLRAERPALAGEAGADLLKMKVSSLAGRKILMFKILCKVKKHLQVGYLFSFLCVL